MKKAPACDFSSHTNACLKFHILFSFRLGWLPRRFLILLYLLFVELLHNRFLFLWLYQRGTSGRFLLLRCQHLVNPVSHVPQSFYICLNSGKRRLTFLMFGCKLASLCFQGFGAVRFPVQMDFQVTDGGGISVKFRLVTVLKFLFFPSRKLRRIPPEPASRLHSSRYGGAWYQWL